MIRAWTSSQYLGHKNLKDALDAIKRSVENVALTNGGLIVYPDTATTAAGGGIGGFLRVVSTFVYRIEDVAYLKGVGITQTPNTGDKTCCLIPHDATDNTASGGYDVTATYYRAGVLLIDADGVFTVKMSDTQAGKALGISLGGRAGALRNLINDLSTSDIDGKAIVAFYVIGDGTNAFTSTSSLTIATNLDLYQCGGMVLSSGVSTDGNQMLGLL